jgi:protein-disulfide isomerase
METPQSSFMNQYLTPIAVILAGVIIAFALIYGHGANTNNGAPSNGAKPQAAAVDIKNVKTDGEPFVGNANAPTTVALFYDYQCPFCKQFELNVSPKIVDAYVKTGKTKVVFKDFQFLGNDSTTAALFGRALWESQPDKFYEWYVAMFNAQDQEGDQGFGNLASIQKLAATIPGLDVAKVTKLMTDKKDVYQKAVDADRAEGNALGINGTPSIIVGKQLLTGMSTDQYFSAISAALDAQLKK